MRDKWYGDKRDLVKWGALLKIAERHRAKHILQILYYRASEYASVEVDEEPVELSTAVRKHFRSISSVSGISCSAQIEVMTEPFGDRASYQSKILERIHRRPQFPGIVFLDPDTGLEPPGRGRPEHVLESEVSEIWRNLRSGDVLALYQHQTNRNGSPCIEPKRGQLARVLTVGPSRVRVAKSPGIAEDVVLFFVEKNVS